MTYAFQVTVERHSAAIGKDSYTFTVAAEKAEAAIRKALRQAQTDSGWKRFWRCTKLERGGWIVS